MIFPNRIKAGEKLAKKLKNKAFDSNTIVVGIFGGGVCVAKPVADALNFPLDSIVVQKLVAPENQDLGIGAVSAIGDGVYNNHLISLLGIQKDYLRKEMIRQKECAYQIVRKLEEKRGSAQLKGKNILLVDEGVATGVTVRTAISTLQEKAVAEITLAVPVGPPKTIDALSKEVDEIICLCAPTMFQSVKDYYREFEAMGYEKVMDILAGKSVSC